MIKIDEFKNIELLIAKIVQADEIPGADKLYHLTIDVGDTTKKIVAGIKPFYKKEDLVGRNIVVLNNLEPAVIRGVESQAMLLAASDEKGISILGPDRDIKAGSKTK